MSRSAASPCPMRRAWPCTSGWASARWRTSRRSDTSSGSGSMTVIGKHPRESLMYVPSHFEEARLEVLHGLMRAQPLATVVTLSADGINANHIPLHLAPDQGRFGTLRGHVARSNPIWSNRVQDVETLAI